MADDSPRAVIFDLDGVLVDSEIWWDEARAAFAAGHERSWTADDRTAVMGANSRQWSRTMRERLGLEMAETEIERAVVDAVVARYQAEGAPRIHGAADAVRAIAGRHRAAVASSAHMDVIRAALEAIGLDDVFGTVVSSDEVDHGKPEPDVYLEAARRLGVDPAACVVIEDSLNGVKSAKAAGMRVVLVPNESVPPASGTAELADVTLGRLADLDPDTLEPRARPARSAGTSARPARAGPPIAAWRRTVRYWLSRSIASFVVRAWVRPSLDGRERLPAGPAVLCFNHLNWSDPFMLMAVLPFRPRLHFFGPMEEDMGRGARNVVMAWTGTAVPYRPGKDDLLEATRRVRAVFERGGVLAIAGEGRIHAREDEVLPLNDGAAYFALRSGVPVVPVAINGTSWLRFGGRVTVRIGEPIAADGRPTRDTVAALTERIHAALEDLVAGQPARPRPGPVGRRLTELFNAWPEGSREAALVASAERDATPPTPG